MKTAIKVVLTAVAYLATFIFGATSGIIHPACYAYIGALLPLLTAFVYLYTCFIIFLFPVIFSHRKHGNHRYHMLNSACTTQIS